MNIGLLAVDSNYPNLALMKLSAAHKANGDNVDWYNPFDTYDIVYLSKIFSFTNDYQYPIVNAQLVKRGGTGYDYTTTLPVEIDSLQPDYSLYPSIDNRTAYGFLTRGCVRHCKWCIVPKKEGFIKPYMNIEQIAVNGRDKVVLMDNNVLAIDYGLEQIEKIAKLGIHVDFNQGLDARLVTEDVAQLLAKTKWIKRIRLACDTPAQIAECDKAIDRIDKYGYKGEYLIYCILLDDINECYERVTHWRNRGSRFYPFCQPYRDLTKPNIIPMWQKDMANWANKRQRFCTCDFKDYQPRKNFKCNKYFEL